MRLTPGIYLGVATVAITAFAASLPAPLSAQQETSSTIEISNADIGGVVAGPNGPEVGLGHRRNDGPADQVR